MKEYFVYMLRCEGERLYTGYTVDVKKRFAAHSGGRAGAKFTRGFRPLGIAALWMVTGNRGAAMKVEALIKSLDRQEKEMLVEQPVKLEEMALNKEIQAEVSVCDVSDYKIQNESATETQRARRKREK